MSCRIELCEKARKNESRTYFFDKAAEKLNRRMLEDEERERMRKR